jgi:hypothetical protein
MGSRTPGGHRSRADASASGPVSPPSPEPNALTDACGFSIWHGSDPASSTGGPGAGEPGDLSGAMGGLAGGRFRPPDAAYHFGSATTSVTLLWRRSNVQVTRMCRIAPKPFWNFASVSISLVMPVVM